MTEPKLYGGHTLAHWQAYLDRFWYPPEAALRDLIAAAEECERWTAQRALRKQNDWCKGIDLGDGNFSGCACDCPACKLAHEECEKLRAELAQTKEAIDSAAVAEHARLIVERDQLRAENERLRNAILLGRKLDDAPCCICGYKGRGYFSNQHACMAARRALEETK